MRPTDALNAAESAAAAWIEDSTEHSPKGSLTRGRSARRWQSHNARSEKVPGDQIGEDDISDEYMNLDELFAPPPIDPGGSQSTLSHKQTLSAPGEEENPAGDTEENKYENLDELVVPEPVENPRESSIYHHSDLEKARTNEQEIERRDREEGRGPSARRSGSELSTQNARGDRLLQMRNHLYVTSYLIFFSILGTLARLGLQALTIYPGAPVAFSELWANVGGSLIMGFLSEDRALFRREWQSAVSNARREATPSYGSPNDKDDEEKLDEVVMATAVKAHQRARKTVPLFIGLSVGFCGSFTSFSSFVRDVFFTLSNQLNTGAYDGSKVTASSNHPRNPGASVMGVLAILIVEICVCLSALEGGAHIAIVLQPAISKTPTVNLRRILDPVMVIVACGSWLGAVSMSIWPPDRPSGPAALGRITWAQETWRGDVVFALVFAPLGCLLRFHASLLLNGRISWFPLGTFVVNIGGTMLLGACWDLQHVGLAKGVVGGGRVGCQVLQGVEDGFCGCLTTVSTWVIELKGLQRRHAYFYGLMSVGLALTSLVVIMGTLLWRRGDSMPACNI